LTGVIQSVPLDKGFFGIIIIPAKEVQVAAYRNHVSRQSEASNATKAVDALDDARICVMNAKYLIWIGVLGSTESSEW
jgi:type IV secretory pathway protease TraF